MRGPGGYCWLLWAAFLIVHVVYGALFLGGLAGGDVQNFYLPWFDQARQAHQIVGITSDWVYPLLAWVPIGITGLVAHAFSWALPQNGDTGFALTWLLLVIALDSAAFAVLTRRMSRNRAFAAGWWILALIALGPVVIGRLDTVSAALAMMAVVVVASRPRLAGTLLALGTWVKVWPAALLLAFAVALERRVRIVVAAAVTAVVVVVVGVALGGAGHLFSFISAQAGRGLQIEAPLATPWLWADAAGAGGIRIYWDTVISTFQLAGPGVRAAATLSTVLLVAAVLCTAVFALRAVLRHADASRTAAALALALTAVLIVFNKVGSPQYQLWYIPVIVFGLLVSVRWFRVPAVLVLAACLLTQLIYPYFYQDLLVAQPWIVGVITARNLLEAALMVWALVALWRVPAAARVPEASDGQYTGQIERE